MHIGAESESQMQTITQTKGRDLVSLAQALAAQKENSRDLVIPTQKLEMSQDGKLGFVNGTDQFFDLNNWSRSQLSGYTAIPKQYFDRISEENKPLLADMVNHSLIKTSLQAKEEGKSESRMLRTVGPTIRALVSGKFRRLDAFDLLNETLPILLDNQFEPISCELTEKRVYVKAVTKKITSEVKVNDPVQFGVMFSTSDVGAGSLALEPFIYRLVCLNGMVTESTIKKRHIGRNQASDNIEELLSQSTLELGDRAFFAQLRDVLTASMKPEVFEREVNKMRKAADIPIKNFDLENVVELAMRSMSITGDNTKKSILDSLASGNQGAGLTMWGLANSFTAAAKAEHLDYDQSVELERAGGEIINLNANQWKHIAEIVH